MNKYDNILKKFNLDIRLEKLLNFKENILSDEIFLEEDIHYNTLYDDLIVSNDSAIYEDLYTGDTLYYIE